MHYSAGVWVMWGLELGLGLAAIVDFRNSGPRSTKLFSAKVNPQGRIIWCDYVEKT